MPLFSYTYFDELNRLQQATAEAPTEQALLKELTSQGFQVKEISLVHAQQGKRRAGRAKLPSLAIFCRQFSAMVDAGVSLVRCLSILSSQTEDPVLKSTLLDVAKNIESGESLSRSMQYHPKTFNSLFIGLVKAGEIGGVLDKTLQRLAIFLEKEVELRRKVKAALTYPTLVLVAAIGIVIFLVSWVVPKFAELFNGLGLGDTSFPPATEFLMNLSKLFTEEWIKLVVGVVVIFITWRLFIRTKTGHRFGDYVKLKVPVFGKLHHKVCLARFSRTLGTLLGSGVPILQAMETVAGTVGNVIISDALLSSRERIRQGQGISGPLQASGLFPPMVVHMVHVGEESGSLDTMLSKISDFYDTEIDSTLASLTAAIEPILIVVLGLIVGFIVIAMFMPALSVMEKLSSGSYG